MKLCRDCKFFRGLDECFYDKEVISPVWGMPLVFQSDLGKVPLAISALHMRSAEWGCGKDANFFEPKESKDEHSN